jgi:hypothetical protein
MAESRQFGSPKVSPSGNQAGDVAHCRECEAMLADALDGTLSASDQASFDLHMAHCGPCAEMLADARRGAAWLEMLRDPRPEPTAALLERILAQTSGSAIGVADPGIDEVHIPGTVLTPAPIYGGSVPHISSGSSPYGVAGYGGVAAYGKVIPFRSRVAAAVRASAFGQIALQPRLAMTAAMAFFSVALTMDLTGVRLQDLRASDLSPSSLQRDFYSANARVVQYYEGLRVVYELESRVHDLQSANGDDTPAGAQSAAPEGSDGGASQGSESGGSQKGSQPGSAPSGQSPSGPANQTPSEQPGRKQHSPAARPAPNSGTSHRDDLNENRRLVAASRSEGETFDARPERTLA